jgi:hypothetical protein
VSDDNSLLDQLPLFSAWPRRLLGLEPTPEIHKTPEEVTREYDREKWGALLNKIDVSGVHPTLDAVDSFFLASEGENLCALGNSFKVMSALDANLAHVRAVQETLKTLMPFPHLVELGAGYGGVLLRLALNGVLRGASLHAGEYTHRGVELIQRVAAAEGLDVSVGHCDFSSVPMVDFDLPEGAVVFTSLAVTCVPHLPTSFLDQLLAAKPLAVVHFEPIAALCSDDSLLGLLRKRYIEINDYNQNLWEILEDYQRRGLLQIVSVVPSVFGANTLLTASAVVWKPT